MAPDSNNGFGTLYYYQQNCLKCDIRVLNGSKEIPGKTQFIPLGPGVWPWLYGTSIFWRHNWNNSGIVGI